jgi:HTH-type transcriptional regulator, competence development regulator
MSPPKKNFGSILRATRVEKGFSLRKFAEKVGVSPTYLSLVETGQAPYQPTVDRIKRMAELLDANADEWIQLAGRVSDELEEMNRDNPQMMPALLRIARNTPPEELAKLAAKAERQSQEKGKK